MRGTCALWHNQQHSMRVRWSRFKLAYYAKRKQHRTSALARCVAHIHAGATRRPRCCCCCCRRCARAAHADPRGRRPLVAKAEIRYAANAPSRVSRSRVTPIRRHARSLQRVVALPPTHPQAADCARSPSSSKPPRATPTRRTLRRARTLRSTHAVARRARYGVRWRGCPMRAGRCWARSHRWGGGEGWATAQRMRRAARRSARERRCRRLRRGQRCARARGAWQERGPSTAAAPHAS